MLCIRALVPAGFMLVPVDGRAVIVLCDSDAQGPAHHHHAGQDHAGHPQHTHADPTCPYAQSAGPAPLPALPVLAAAPDVYVFELPGQLEQIHTRFGPAREQRPRGPPHLHLT